MFAAIRLNISDTPTLMLGRVQNFLRSTVVATFLMSTALVGCVPSSSAQNTCSTICPDHSQSETFDCSDPNYVPACYRSTGASGSSTAPSVPASASGLTPQQQMGMAAAAAGGQVIGNALGQALHQLLFGSPPPPPPLIDPAEQQRQLAARQLNDSGIYLLKQKNYAGAINEFQKALAYTPNDADILSNLAVAKQKLKEATIAAQTSGALGQILGNAPASSGLFGLDLLGPSTIGNPNGSALNLVNLDSDPNVVDLRGTTKTYVDPGLVKRDSAQPSTQPAGAQATVQELDSVLGGGPDSDAKRELDDFANTQLPHDPDSSGVQSVPAAQPEVQTQNTDAEQTTKAIDDVIGQNQTAVTQQSLSNAPGSIGNPDFDGSTTGNAPIGIGHPDPAQSAPAAQPGAQNQNTAEEQTTKAIDDVIGQNQTAVTQQSLSNAPGSVGNPDFDGSTTGNAPIDIGHPNPTQSGPSAPPRSHGSGSAQPAPAGQPETQNQMTDTERRVAARCEELDSQIGKMKDVARRANLALDVYSFFDDSEANHNNREPWQAEWKAPTGFTLLSNNIAETRELLPNKDDAEIKQLLAPDDSQYRAAIYRDNAKGTIFLVFRGTDTTQNYDDYTKANVPNVLQGAYTEYFAKARYLALELRQYTDRKGVQLECVGHSLGGGMCITAAVHAHVKATVFNAETIHSSALPKGDDIQAANDLVVDYVTPREPLTSLQDAIYLDAPGAHVSLPDWSGGPLSGSPTSLSKGRHQMWFVRLSIQNKIQELEKERTVKSCARINYKPTRLQGAVPGTTFNGLGSAEPPPP